jgi:hypothetical protein
MHLAILLAAATLAAAGQTADEDFKVYTEHPRLLLPAQRLRLLRRERERQSPRWLQLETLTAGKAQMPESAFALALFHQVARDQAAGRQAIETVLKSRPDLRQTALVYDWCFELLAEGEKAAIEERLRQPVRLTSFATARDAAFAAVASGNAAGMRAVMAWWRQQAAPELRDGVRPITHADIYPFMEFLHSVRDNFQVDLREDMGAVFRDLPLQRVLSYYPAIYPAPENEYHIPFYSGKGEPDLRIAALTRSAEFAMVAYDSNALETQFLQGWLLHDRFVLRGAFGAPYEFLWANPYQPGLPFEKLPLFLHEKRTGTLLVRSSWDEDATWAGYFGGSLQIFRDGGIQLASTREPLTLGETIIVPTTGDLKTRIAPESVPQWFVLGLRPQTVYDVEVDDEDLTEAQTDRGGILPFEFTRTDNQLVWIRERRRAKIGAGAPIP